MKNLLSAIIAALLLSATFSFGAAVKPRTPGAADKCPVCGMFVAKYPGFAAQVQLKDGRVYHFDGSKDLFTFYQNLSRYAPGKKAADVAAVLVTNYYDMAIIDGAAAWYVAGSNVTGPMGAELVPFRKEADAKEFAKDHKGKKILRFRDITPAVLAGLS